MWRREKAQPVWRNIAPFAVPGLPGHAPCLKPNRVSTHPVYFVYLLACEGEAQNKPLAVDQFTPQRCSSLVGDWYTIQIQFGPFTEYLEIAAILHFTVSSFFFFKKVTFNIFNTFDDPKPDKFDGNRTFF